MAICSTKYKYVYVDGQGGGGGETTGKSKTTSWWTGLSRRVGFAAGLVDVMENFVPELCPKQNQNWTIMVSVNLLVMVKLQLGRPAGDR